MKNLKLYIIALVAVILISCKDFLEVTPRDFLVEETAFQSLEDLEAGAVGVYAAVSGTNLIDLSSRMGDNLKIGGENRGQGRQTHGYAFNSSTGEAAGAWGNFYGVVSRANRVLAGIDRLIDAGVVTAEETNYIKGEMLVIRAMEHFDLWRIYSEKYNPSSLAVPWISLEDLDENGRLDGLDPDIQPSRQITEFLFGKIDADLAQARSLMGGGANNDVFRVTRTAVIALQARVALYSERYTQAITHADAVLEKVDLATRAVYPYIWTDSLNTEIIFALRRVSGDGNVGTLFTDSNGDRFFQPAEGYIDLFDRDNDIRYITNIGTGKNGNVVGKYPGSSEDNKGLNNIKIFRASEMHLILSEAYAWEKDLIKGGNALNALRSNRIKGYVAETFASQSDLLDAVETERRKELGYEGHRWFDLKRRSKDLVRDSRDCTSGAIPCSVASTDYKWRFPIPQGEIFANDNMEQNPGYTTSEKE